MFKRFTVKIVTQSYISLLSVNVMETMLDMFVFKKRYKNESIHKCSFLSNTEVGYRVLPSTHTHTQCRFNQIVIKILE